jgi:hypothetical protein
LSVSVLAEKEALCIVVFVLVSSAEAVVVVVFLVVVAVDGVIR